MKVKMRKQDMGQRENKKQSFREDSKKDMDGRNEAGDEEEI